MFRIDNGTQASVPPTIPSAGTPGYFQTGVPGTSTIVDAVWATMLQEELVAICAAANLTLSKPSWTQVQQAIRRISAANVTSINASAALTADNLGLVEISAALWAVTVTLPAAQCLASGTPARLRLLRTDTTSGHAVTVQRAGSNALAGGTLTSFTLACGESVDLISDGSGSWSVRRSGPTPWTILTSGAGTIYQPVGYTQVESEVIGAAGGGAGSTSGANAGGGGAGGTARKTITGVPHGTSMAYTVAVGGPGGAAGANGSAGSGNTALTVGSTLLYASPGSGGVYGASPAGGGPGGGVGGDENIGGGYGADGPCGGTGGSGSLGGGGRAANSGAGYPGNAPGAGGGAGYGGSVPGGAGANGQIRIRSLP